MMQEKYLWRESVSKNERNQYLKRVRTYLSLVGEETLPDGIGGEKIVYVPGNMKKESSIEIGVKPATIKEDISFPLIILSGWSAAIGEYTTPLGGDMYIIGRTVDGALKYVKVEEKEEQTSDGIYKKIVTITERKSKEIKLPKNVISPIEFFIVPRPDGRIEIYKLLRKDGPNNVLVAKEEKKK